MLSTHLYTFNISLNSQHVSLRTQHLFTVWSHLWTLNTRPCTQCVFEHSVHHWRFTDTANDCPNKSQKKHRTMHVFLAMVTTTYNITIIKNVCKMNSEIHSNWGVQSSHIFTLSTRLYTLKCLYNLNTSLVNSTDGDTTYTTHNSLTSISCVQNRCQTQEPMGTYLTSIFGYHCTIRTYTVINLSLRLFVDFTASSHCYWRAYKLSSNTLKESGSAFLKIHMCSSTPFTEWTIKSSSRYFISSEHPQHHHSLVQQITGHRTHSSVLSMENRLACWPSSEQHNYWQA